MVDNTAQAQMVAHVKEDGKRSTMRSSMELKDKIRNNKDAFPNFAPERQRLAEATQTYKVDLDRVQKLIDEA